jgi:hypothetical protein
MMLCSIFLTQVDSHRVTVYSFCRGLSSSHPALNEADMQARIPLLVSENDVTNHSWKYFLIMPKSERLSFAELKFCPQ